VKAEESFSRLAGFALLSSIDRLADRTSRRSHLHVTPACPASSESYLAKTHHSQSQMPIDALYIR